MLVDAIITWDFETYFKRSNPDPFTLSKMSTVDYVRSPRFDPHGIGIKIDDKPSVWYDKYQLPEVMRSIPWDRVAVLGHHQNFDGLISSHHFGVVPKFYLDTYSMARQIFGLGQKKKFFSLENLSIIHELQPKTVPYDAMDGKHWEELDEWTRNQVAVGCCGDCDNTYNLFGRLLKNFPAEGLIAIDQVLRFFCRPLMIGNIPKLKAIWEAEEARKVEDMKLANVGEKDLQSAAKFCALLESEGVEVEMKPSPRVRGREIPAIAATDDFVREVLLSHPNPRVQALTRARLGVKSTQLQGYAEKLGLMAETGRIPINLAYPGTLTGRGAGDDGFNSQNMKRGSPLYECFEADEDHVAAVIDESQIECRMLATLSGQTDEVERFQNNHDPYIPIASQFYGREITKKDKSERGFGKQSILMCLGPDTLVLTDRGAIPITEVQATDRVWDGIEWVTCKGAVSRGRRNVINLVGLWITEDHGVLCGDGFLPAGQLNEKTLSRALENASVNLPLPGISSLPGAGWFLSSSDAVAASKITRFFRLIWPSVAQRVAMIAPNVLQAIGPKSITATPISALTIRIAAVFWAAYRQFLIDAVRLDTFDTDAVELEFIRNGKIDEIFWPIWFGYQDGMTQPWKLTVSKTIGAMNPATSDSRPAPQMWPTALQSHLWKKNCETYDVACAGPRERFTVVTAAGPLIVHNCGYQAGWKRFRGVAKLGLYGPSIDMSEEDARRAVGLYRQTHQAVVNYWDQCAHVIGTLAAGDHLGSFGPGLIEGSRITLPNGFQLIYDSLVYAGIDHAAKTVRIDLSRALETEGLIRAAEFLETRLRTRLEEGREVEPGFFRIHRGGWTRMYAGMLTEHMCSGLSQVVIQQAQPRLLDLGVQIVHNIHDALWFLMPRDGHEQERFEACGRAMIERPKWLPSLPLAAEGHWGRDFGKGEEYGFAPLPA